MTRPIRSTFPTWMRASLMPNPLERNISCLKEHLAKAFNIQPERIVEDRAELTWLLGTLARLRVPVDVAFQVTGKRLFIYEPMASASVKAMHRHYTACDNGDGCDVWEQLPNVKLYGVEIEVERLHNLLRFTPELRLPVQEREFLPSHLPPLDLPENDYGTDPEPI